jgi:formylmethanofuran dehydrogenase subunit E
MEASLKEFLQTWQKRKSGALLPVDLTVECSSCGAKVMGDGKVEFTPKGLVCESCFKKGV